MQASAAYGDGRGARPPQTDASVHIIHTPRNLAFAIDIHSRALTVEGAIPERYSDADDETAKIRIRTLLEQRNPAVFIIAAGIPYDDKFPNDRLLVFQRDTRGGMRLLESAVRNYVDRVSVGLAGLADIPKPTPSHSPVTFERQTWADAARHVLLGTGSLESLSEKHATAPSPSVAHTTAPLPAAAHTTYASQEGHKRTFFNMLELKDVNQSGDAKPNHHRVWLALRPLQVIVDQRAKSTVLIFDTAETASSALARLKADRLTPQHVRATVLQRSDCGTLFIGNLPLTVTIDALSSHLASLAPGIPCHAQLPQTKRGFAHVHFPSHADAELALSRLNGTVLERRTLRVEMAKQANAMQALLPTPPGPCLPTMPPHANMLPASTQSASAAPPHGGIGSKSAALSVAPVLQTAGKAPESAAADATSALAPTGLPGTSLYLVPTATCLHFGNLPWDVDEKRIKAILPTTSTPTKLHIQKCRDGRTARAAVTFSSHVVAVNVKKSSPREFEGRRLYVEWHHVQPSANPQPVSTRRPEAQNAPRALVLDDAANSGTTAPAEPVGDSRSQHASKQVLTRQPAEALDSSMGRGALQLSRPVMIGVQASDAATAIDFTQLQTRPHQVSNNATTQQRPIFIRWDIVEELGLVDFAVAACPKPTNLAHKIAYGWTRLSREQRAAIADLAMIGAVNTSDRDVKTAVDRLKGDAILTELIDQRRCSRSLHKQRVFLLLHKVMNIQGGWEHASPDQMYELREYLTSGFLKSVILHQVRDRLLLDDAFCPDADDKPSLRELLTMKEDYIPLKTGGELNRCLLHALSKSVVGYESTDDQLDGLVHKASACLIEISARVGQDIVDLYTGADPGFSFVTMVSNAVRDQQEDSMRQEGEAAVASVLLQRPVHTYSDAPPGREGQMHHESQKLSFPGRERDGTARVPHKPPIYAYHGQSHFTTLYDPTNTAFVMANIPDLVSICTANLNQFLKGIEDLAKDTEWQARCRAQPEVVAWLQLQAVASRPKVEASSDDESGDSVQILSTPQSSPRPNTADEGAVSRRMITHDSHLTDSAGARFSLPDATDAAGQESRGTSPSDEPMRAMAAKQEVELPASDHMSADVVDVTYPQHHIDTAAADTDTVYAEFRRLRTEAFDQVSGCRDTFRTTLLSANPSLNSFMLEADEMCNAIIAHHAGLEFPIDMHHNVTQFLHTPLQPTWTASDLVAFGFGIAMLTTAFAAAPDQPANSMEFKRHYPATLSNLTALKDLCARKDVVFLLGTDEVAALQILLGICCSLAAALCHTVSMEGTTEPGPALLSILQKFEELHDAILSDCRALESIPIAETLLLTLTHGDVADSTIPLASIHTIRTAIDVLSDRLDGREDLSAALASVASTLDSIIFCVGDFDPDLCGEDIRNSAVAATRRLREWYNDSPAGTRDGMAGTDVSAIPVATSTEALQTGSLTEPSSSIFPGRILASQPVPKVTTVPPRGERTAQVASQHSAHGLSTEMLLVSSDRSLRSIMSACQQLLQEQSTMHLPAGMSLRLDLFEKLRRAQTTADKRCGGKHPWANARKNVLEIISSLADWPVPPSEQVAAAATVARMAEKCLSSMQVPPEADTSFMPFPVDLTTKQAAARVGGMTTADPAVSADLLTPPISVLPASAEGAAGGRAAGLSKPRRLTGGILRQIALTTGAQPSLITQMGTGSATAAPPGITIKPRIATQART